MYDCDCEDCKTQKQTLALGENKIKPLLTAVEAAFKQLHIKGSYKPEAIAKTKAYKDLITATSGIFNTAITDNDIPEAMAKNLKEDVFLFSGLKTHAQLAEASRLLLTEDGKVKSFSAFSKDVQSIKENYNQHYLDAEYQFAVSSAQSAGNWANINNDYDLQYRTAEDDRVRESHEALRVTLPADDAFWVSYYPPNGWRCRCTAVQVRKGKYEVDDSKTAIAKGESATTQLDKNGNNKLAIFRFNPGMQKVIFPPSHPYHKVAGAETVKKELKEEKYILNEENIKDLEKRNFKLDLNDDGIKLFNEKFKGFNFAELDEGMNKTAKKFNLKFDKKIIESDDTNIYFKYYDTKNGFTLERKLFVKNDVKTVYHSYFQINKDLQGGGISKEVFKNLYKQYRNADLDKVTVYANIDVGGYTWGRYGFSANNIEDVNNIYKKAKRLTSEGTLSADNLKHFERCYEDFSKNGKSFNMHRVSSSEYGKKLLLRTDWRGELNLKDKVQTKIFEEYLGY